MTGCLILREDKYKTGMSHIAEYSWTLERDQGHMKEENYPINLAIARTTSIQPFNINKCELFHLVSKDSAGTIHSFLLYWSRLRSKCNWCVSLPLVLYCFCNIMLSFTSPLKDQLFRRLFQFLDFNLILQSLIIPGLFYYCSLPIA